MTSKITFPDTIILVIETSMTYLAVRAAAAETTIFDHISIEVVVMG